jgi:hypothetical protein
MCVGLLGTATLFFFPPPQNPVTTSRRPIVEISPPGE